MSDMSHLTRAYAAVHNTEIKENLSNHRDGISEMDLTQLTDVDLYEVAEEVLEEVFTETSDVADAKKLIEAIFINALQGDSSPVRTAKLERLGEAFVKAFDRVTEKSIRVAVESYSDYRRGKERLARLNDNPNHDRSKERIHAALVAEDRKIVKDNLLSMIESVGTAVDKALGAVGDTAKVAGKAAVGTAKGAAGAVKVASKVVKGVGKAAGRIAGTPVGAVKAIKKGYKSAANDESFEFSPEVEKLIESGKFSDAEIAKIADILAQLEKKRIRQGGNPDESPLGKKTGRAMKAQQDKARSKK